MKIALRLWLLCFFTLCSSIGMTHRASAQVDLNTDKFYFTFNMAGVIFEESAHIYGFTPFGKARIPGSLNLQNKAVPLCNLGYYITPQLSIDLVFGPDPPRAQVHGAKQASAIGYIGSLRVAPAFISLLYHYNHNRFHFYIGPGFNYTLFFGAEDAPGVHHLTVQSHHGYGFTVGISEDINRTLSWSLAVSQILLSTHAKGILTTPIGPVRASLYAQANPLAIQTGLTIHF
jgi:outer membrane protein